MNKRAKGFTLIEVMVVVVILGILVGTLVTNIDFGGRTDQARVTAARLEVQQVGNALEYYRLDNGFYPSTDQGLEALVTSPTGFPEPKNWNPSGYLNAVPEDPWDEPYHYYNEGRTVDVYSLGADRQEGGEGVDADIRLSDI